MPPIHPVLASMDTAKLVLMAASVRQVRTREGRFDEPSLRTRLAPRRQLAQGATA